MPNRNTDKLAHCIQAEEATLPADEQGATRLIDLHLYPLPASEASRDEAASSEDVSQEQPATFPGEEGEPEIIIPIAPQQHRRRPHLLVLTGVGGLLLALVTITLLVIWPLVEPAATITIIPISKQISATTRIQIASSTAPNGHTIAGRLLATVSMSEQRSIATTGKAHQDAQAAHGLVTFYNAATYPQIIPAGTLLTSVDQVQVVTDQNASIPAGTLATNGQATVSAHAVQVGPRGNLKAGAVYGPCCRVNVFAANAAFTGGQEARDYPTVTQQDISEAATSIKTQLDQSVQAALQSQLHSDETLVTPQGCTLHISPDHQPGEEATQVRLQVSETCTGVAYNTQAYHDELMQVISEQAHQQLGQGYDLHGEIQATITETTITESTITLQVQASGSYIYQFTQEQQDQVKHRIAGKSKAEALSVLLAMPGVQSASLAIKNGGTTLPTAEKEMQISFLLLP